MKAFITILAVTCLCLVALIVGGSMARVHLDRTRQVLPRRHLEERLAAEKTEEQLSAFREAVQDGSKTKARSRLRRLEGVLSAEDLASAVNAYELAFEGSASKTKARAEEEAKAPARSAPPKPRYKALNVDAPYGARWKVRMNRATGEVDVEGVAGRGSLPADSSNHKLGAGYSSSVRPSDDSGDRFHIAGPGG